ncbi:MAG: DUF1330 domain-containing protein [Gammaproteobacteria bacterium]|jgi:uncharacterized protein (DUF1330 family)|nr:DUF1330 domain-containing protein [Gammaproteobacteria bacterium]
MTKQAYLDPTQEQGRDFFLSGFTGAVTMLNLLRFRAVADYSMHENLAPPAPITGAQAYLRYMKHTMPYLRASGGELVFYGDSTKFLVGPTDEHWDAAMLVRQSSVQSFLAFATDRDYLAGIGHRVAALSDSRILPLQQAEPFGS